MGKVKSNLGPDEDLGEDKSAMPAVTQPAPNRTVKIKDADGNKVDTVVLERTMSQRSIIANSGLMKAPTKGCCRPSFKLIGNSSRLV